MTTTTAEGATTTVATSKTTTAAPGIKNSIKLKTVFFSRLLIYFVCNDKSYFDIKQANQMLTANIEVIAFTFILFIYIVV